MLLFFKCLLCFSIFPSSPESLRCKILDAFDQKQEDNGYLFLNRAVLGPGSFHGYLLHYHGFKKRLTIDEARILLVTNVEDMLARLNSADKKVTDTFYRHPLMPNDINLGYVFMESEGVFASPPYVYGVSSHHDVIDYDFHTHDSVYDDISVTESYNEAYEKVYGKPRQPLCEPRKPPTNSDANPQ